MALIFWEGFDKYNNLTEFFTSIRVGSPIFSVQNGNFSNYTFSTTGGRFGGCAIQDASTGFAGAGTADPGQVIFSNSVNEIWIGRAVKINTTIYETRIQAINMTGYADPTSYDGVIRVGPDGTISVFRNGTFGWHSAGAMGTAIANTAPGAFTFNVWHFMEMRWKQSTSNTSSDGIVEIWLDNQQVMNVTNANTRVSSSNIQSISIVAKEYKAGSWTDDIYVLDTSGSAPWNTRLGDIRIATVVPTIDVGPNQGVVSTGNVNHWTAIDESRPNTADWLSIASANSGNGEMFAHAQLPSIGSNNILATSVNIYTAKTDAGNANFKISIQSGGTRANSNTINLLTSNTYFISDWVTDPSTSSQWSNSAWHSSNIGFYIV